MVKPLTVLLLDTASGLILREVTIKKHLLPFLADKVDLSLSYFWFIKVNLNAIVCIRSGKHFHRPLFAWFKTPVPLSYIYRLTISLCR
jgi:hypothetical protein